MNDNGFIEPAVVATNGGLGKMFLSAGTPSNQTMNTGAITTAEPSPYRKIMQSHQMNMHSNNTASAGGGDSPTIERSNSPIKARHAIQTTGSSAQNATPASVYSQ